MRPDLITIQWEIDLDLRAVLAANALWCDGLSAARPDDVPLIEALWGPPPKSSRWPLEVPYRYDRATRRTQGISGCGLTYDGICERSGVAWPWRGMPYRPGTAVARDEAFARDAGAWSTGADDARQIAPGDGVIVGTGMATHVLTVVAWDGDVLVSVDGGQVDSTPHPVTGRVGLQCIRMCRRALTRRGGSWWLGGRQLHGWVRTSELPWEDTIVVPGEVS